MALTAEAGRGFSDRLTEFVDYIEYRTIDDPDGREAVYRLRYDAYAREGTIPAGFPKRFTDDFDDLPNCWIVGLYVEGQLASSIRLHISSPGQPEGPATAVFPDILMPEIARGHVIVDPTRFVTDYALARQHPELPYATVRLAFLASEHFDADFVLATVRVEHQAFYRRMFGFRSLCEPRRYPSLAKPISLMAIHCETTRAGILRRNPYLVSSPEECAALFDRAPLAPLRPGVPAERPRRAVAV